METEKDETIPLLPLVRSSSALITSRSFLVSNDAFGQQLVDLTRTSRGYVRHTLLNDSNTQEKLQKIRPYIWKLGQDGEIVEHNFPEDTQHAPSENTERTDLLFLDDNQFEILEFVGFDNNTPSAANFPIYPLPKLFKHRLNDVFKKGITNVLFRITQPPMHILESIYLSWINTQKPGAFAAGGITYVMKSFLVHTPGAFLHLLPMKFNPNSKKNSANLFYAAFITVTALNSLMVPIMVFSGDILESIFGLDPVTSKYVQEFFLAFIIGSYALQWFSLNRQFINSLCGDKHHSADENYKLMMPLVGGLELAVYGILGYEFITGNWNLPFIGNVAGNAGSGYAFSISAWVAFLASSAGLLLKKSFREYILQTPDLELIQKNIKMILSVHAPVALRFVAESVSLIVLASFAGKISQNSLTALNLCTTFLLPVAGPCFSFIHGARALLNNSIDFRQTAFLTLLIPTMYAALFIIPLSIPPVIRSLSGLLLDQQSAENREAIKDIVQSTAPIMATIEVASCVATEARAIETWGAQKHDQLAKENWVIAGNTIAIQSALFLPLAYAVGLKLDYGLPGMAGLYLLCMVALLLALAPRTINFLKNPTISPHSFWPTFCTDVKNRVRTAVEQRWGNNERRLN